MERQTVFCRPPFFHYFLTCISCFLQLASQIPLSILHLSPSNYLLGETAASIFVLVCIAKDFFQKFYFNILPARTKGIPRFYKFFTFQSFIFPAFSLGCRGYLINPRWPNLTHSQQLVKAPEKPRKENKGNFKRQFLFQNVSEDKSRIGWKLSLLLFFPCKLNHINPCLFIVRKVIFSDNFAESSLITVSQNHQVGRDLQDHPVQPMP